MNYWWSRIQCALLGHDWLGGLCQRSACRGTLRGMTPEFRRRFIEPYIQGTGR